MTKPMISVIVPNYQGKAVFPACIRSLLKQTFGSYEILFIDDGSTDGSASLAEKLFGTNAKVRIARKKRNTGYVGACNHGLRISKGVYVIVTNNDATFPENWLDEMYRTVKGKKKVIGSSFVVHPKEEKKVMREINKGKYSCLTITLLSGIWRKITPEEHRNGIFETHAAGVPIIPRSALQNHIFDKDYFMYGEDVELCWRLRLQGYHIVASKHAVMHHLESFTRKHVPNFNRRATYHGTKNTIMNFFVFWDRVHVAKITPVFLLGQLALFFSSPRKMLARLQAYTWAVCHASVIIRKRRIQQKTRRVADKEILRLMSYAFHGEHLVTNKVGKTIVHVVNVSMRTYCRLFGVETFDVRNDDAVPQVEPRIIARG